MVTLLLRWRSSKIGLTSFNVVVRRFLMSHAHVLRKRQPRVKCDKNARSCFSRLSIEGARDCSDSRQLKRPRGSYQAGELRRFVTIDETWIHWYTPEAKKQYTSPDKRAPKKAKTVLSAGKVMATVFRDSKGVIYIDFAELLGRFRGRKLQKKRPQLGYELLPHPLYSSDLVSCDFSFFYVCKQQHNTRV